jgi:hypothetical protein
MSEQERGKHVKASDEELADVEAHRHHGRGAVEEKSTEEAEGAGKDDEGDDVEAHRHFGRG